MNVQSSVHAHTYSIGVGINEYPVQCIVEPLCSGHHRGTIHVYTPT